MSANSTPVKTIGLNDRDHCSEDDLLNDDTLSRSRRTSELDLWGRLSESRKSSYNNLVPLGENSSSSNIYPLLPDNLYQPHIEVNILKR